MQHWLSTPHPRTTCIMVHGTAALVEYPPPLNHYGTWNCSIGWVPPHPWTIMVQGTAALVEIGTWWFEHMLITYILLGFVSPGKNMTKLGYYHACWCPGSLHHQPWYMYWRHIINVSLSSADRIFQLIWSISCLLMPWLLKSSAGMVLTV